MARPRDELTDALLGALAAGPGTARELAARSGCGVGRVRERLCYYSRIGVVQRLALGPLPRRGISPGKRPTIWGLAPDSPPAVAGCVVAMQRLAAATAGWARG
jgi:hypothetical protein